MCVIYIYIYTIPIIRRRTTRIITIIITRIITIIRIIITIIRIIITIPARTAQGGGGSFKDRKPIGEVDGCDAWMAEQSH